MKSIEGFSPELENLDYTELKSGLLTGTIDPISVFQELLRLDQQTGEHEACVENIRFLEDQQVKEFIDTVSEETKKKYYQILSLSELHYAQNLLFEGKAQLGLGYFKRSLEHEYKSQAFPENILYRRGTIAYLESDTSVLEDSISELEPSRNKAILENMRSGLAERGHPDYVADYSKN